MGGRALKQHGIETERKSTKEFFEIASKIAVQLTYGLGITSSVPVEFKYNPSIQSQIVRCYRLKQDHGDLDVLIKIDNDFHNSNINLKEYIEENFKPRVIHNNGGVYSFDYENFQIDFIQIRESNWDIAQVYYSYDPLGNAMGKIFHKFNLSYGWDGLKYKYRNFNGRNSRDITVCKDPRKIFEFGGFDYDRYLQGFNNIEEIFDYIISGKYFNANIFRMENLNHVDRKRNRKRKSYHELLNYMDDNYHGENKFIFEKNKAVYRPKINDVFPEAKFFDKLNELDKADEINRRLSNKLNGKLIMKWIPGLEGKELGNAINKFRETLGDDYNDVVLHSSPDSLKNKFIEIYNEQ